MKRFAIPLILLLIVADIHCQVELSPKARKAWNVTIPDEKQDKDFDYNQDASIIHRRIKDGNSLAAFRQLKNAIGNNKPENADLLFQYANLAQDVYTGLTNEGYAAAFSLNLAATMNLQAAMNETDILHTTLLFMAANAGHKGASQILQAKAAMRGGGTMNIPNTVPNANNCNTPQTVGSKTCSLCNGKGWIPGSKTPKYGNTGTYWCYECGREVTYSHSHDSCPSCGGKRTVPGF